MALSINTKWDVGGYKMPILGFGTWLLDRSVAERCVQHAIEMGYRHIDCAKVYENEREVGRGIRAAIEEGEGRCSREDLWVTSKCWLTDLQPASVVKACRTSLKELGLDYMDQYLIHWPVAFKQGDDLFPCDSAGKYSVDPNVDMVDTWREMEKCVDMGLTKTIGISNFKIDHIKHILDNCRIRPAVNQIESHPFLLQPELKQFMKEQSIACVAYCPLCAKKKFGDELMAIKDPTIGQIADSKKKTPAQVLLRWGLQQGTIVIPKSANKDRITENCDIFDFELNEDDMNKIVKIGKKVRLCNMPFTVSGELFFKD